MEARLDRDIAFKGGNEVGKAHPERVEIRKQRIENEGAVGVGEHLADDTVVAVVQNDGRAHLGHARRILHLAADAARKPHRGLRRMH